MTTNISVMLLLEKPGWPSNAESKDSEEQLKESSLERRDSNSFTQERNYVFFLYIFGHLSQGRYHQYPCTTLLVV